MKDKKRSRLFRITVDLILSASFLSLLLWLKLAKGYDGGWITVLVFAVIIAVSKLFYDIHEYRCDFGAGKRGRIKSIFRRIFRPIISRMEKKKEEKKKFIRGSTQREFVFGFGRSGKKGRFDAKTKANLKKCRTNGEKLRMMYIRGVLELRDRGCDVTPSKTPGELKKMLLKDDNPALFENYAKMRYGKDFIVDDETLAASGIRK